MGLPIRAGIVGLGVMGITHSAIVNALPSSKVVALCDSNNILTRFGMRVLPGVRFYLDYEKMFAREKLDVVFVTTPGHTHLPIVSELIREDPAISVFVEKPLAASLTESYSLVALGKQLKGKSAVGFQKRYIGTFRKAKDLLEHKALGKLSFYTAINYTGDIFAAARGWKFSKSTGGVALDFSPHILDLILWYFGEPLSVTASRKSIYSTEVEDYFHAVFQHDGGVIGNLDVCWSMPNYKSNELRIDVHGLNGFLSVSQDRLVVQVNDEVPGVIPKGIYTYSAASLTPNPSFLLSLPEFALEDQDFINCILKDVQPENSFENAARVNKVIDLIRTAPLL